MTSNRCAEMGRLNGEVDAPQNRSSMANFCTWFIWSAMFLLVTSAIFAFCFFSHHYHRVSDLCDAQATYNRSGDWNWNWNLTNCPGHLKECDKSLVCINTDGVYLVDIQIHVFVNDSSDIQLETWPSRNHIVAGSYISSKGGSYTVLRTHFVLKKEDRMNLTLGVDEPSISTLSKSTYWKILKLKG